MKSKILFSIRLITAIILLQTLFFKFTGAAESVFIFSKMGVEPWGRWFSGIVELIAAILLLLPSTQIFGALISVGVMFGAILSHIFVLGIEINDDGGLLFLLACVVFVFSSSVLVSQKENIKILIDKLRHLILKRQNSTEGL